MTIRSTGPRSGSGCDGRGVSPPPRTADSAGPGGARSGEAEAAAHAPEIERQAARFKRVRDAHQSELAEDYVELIADLIDEAGEARLVEMASRLGVASATVNSAIQRLVRDGLVTSKPYRAIFLTAEGRELAHRSRERHRIVREVLISLGVDAETAEADAEGIEHHVSEATLAAFRRHLEAAAPRAPAAGVVRDDGPRRSTRRARR